MSRFKSFSPEINVVIVGATGGIGDALLCALLNEAHIGRIFAFSRCQHPPSSCDERIVHGFVDLENERSIEQVGTVLEGVAIDLVIVASGLLHEDKLQPEKALKQVSQANLQRLFQVNTIAPMLLAKALLPKMRRDYRTVFSVLSARVGSISDNRLGGWHGYRSSKSALNMFLKTVSIGEKLKQPACVIAGLHPGTVNTRLSEPFQRSVKPENLFTAEQSAQYLIDVITNLTPEDSGKIFAWDGEEIAP